ncbi:MAG TPA: hypothetical protein VFN07_06100, partial [Trueperaceae bacterium]|nr:hypothetical protein [Trueperaceae bacterium]
MADQRSAPTRQRPRGPSQGGSSDPNMPGGPGLGSSSGQPRGCGTWLLLMVGLFVANYLIVSLFFPAGRGPVEVPYNLFREQV